MLSSPSPAKEKPNPVMESDGSTSTPAAASWKPSTLYSDALAATSFKNTQVPMKAQSVYGPGLDPRSSIFSSRRDSRSCASSDSVPVSMDREVGGTMLNRPSAFSQIGRASCRERV